MIPILVGALDRIDDPFVKEDIVRALSVPWAQDAAGALVTEFEREAEPTRSGLRWAIGNALEVLASEAILDAMIRLGMDRSHGKAREMIVLGLGKVNVRRSIDALVALLDDDEVAGHALSALGKLRARDARARVEALLDHKTAFIRSNAKRHLRGSTLHSSRHRGPVDGSRSGVAGAARVPV